GMLDASFLQTASGGAQEVMFGVYCRRVFDVDVLQKVWTGDLVLTISWNDPAAKKVIPEGQDETRLSSEDARNVMWLPDIGVTNRDFKNLEVISSSVKVWKDGRVTKVERLLATMTNDFDIKAYPYDQQTLEVLVASEKMMADEMVLKPHTDETVTGVKDAVLIGSGFSGMEG
ncbi:Proton-gated ion channel, partial [Durusdinium trenchii]